MTTTAPATSRHPLGPLTVEEIDRFHAVLVTAGLLGETVRTTYVRLIEPSQSEIAAFESGQATPVRRVSALLLDLADAGLTEVEVDLGAAAVTRAETVDGVHEGQAPILDEEYVLADEIVKADPEWCAAILRHGVPSLDQVRTAPLSAGVFGYQDEVGLRVCRVHAFVQRRENGLAWSHPVSGVVAHVDLTNRRVLRVVEANDLPMPTQSYDFLDPAYRGPERTTLRPIEITQPEGVSFTYEDGLLCWQNWSLRVGFNGREGLTLHQLAFQDGEELRSIVHRASISEMVVPYADPAPTHHWQNYFDAGEYEYGRLANSLRLGCDCLGEITYVDAVVCDHTGRPQVIPNAICIHEEDYGTLWKHTDVYNDSSEVRRQRRLVISFFTTVGNYDYGFYWYLYLDGTIQLEVKATGVVFPSTHDGEDETYASLLGPGLGTPYHQHLFSARLHMAVDGTAMSVEEIEAQPVPMGEGNPTGNAFTRSITRLEREADAQRLADPGRGRVWAVSSAERVNRVGRPTSYVLYPQGLPTLLAAEGSSIRARAAFATKHLWVTPFAPEELWAAGDRVNQHPGNAGLPRYVEGNRPIDGENIVLWHTFGLTHFPRLEDWPVMPVDYAGFTLKPHGFFDRNPTLDVPANASSHCGTATDDGGCCHGD
ncbi:primary-amine oxidase [Nocardioides sp.]|uniref:primary-amine oxidase n=1 Tax=Nocardioides sp. TaxID=35761 RepID=UPI0039E253E0